MKKGFYYIIALLIVSLFWSCSTKKNTKASRFYHAFNSRYNIYFNGKTSFDEALLSMQNGYKESYSDLLKSLSSYFYLLFSLQRNASCPTMWGSGTVHPRKSI